MQTSHNPSLAIIKQVGSLSESGKMNYCTYGVTITPSDLKSKSPNALVTAKDPPTLFLKILHPLLIIRSYSIGSLALWSKVILIAYVFLPKTALVSPKFIKYITRLSISLKIKAIQTQLPYSVFFNWFSMLLFI